MEDGLSYPDYSNMQRLLGDGPRMAASPGLVGRPALTGSSDEVGPKYA